MQPVILDLDNSIGAFDDNVRIDLNHWHEPLRFGCSMSALRAFERELVPKMPAGQHFTFMGSGDFHHLSLPLIAQSVSSFDAVQVIVFDNHPDNMRFPFGVHCGSWVWRVASLPQVAQVHVVGITSGDIGASHAWENHLRPLYRGRVCYWSTGVDVRWAKRMRLSHSVRSFDSTEALMAAFIAHQSTLSTPVYLSIDKDVLDSAEAMSNWDQGKLRVTDIIDTIESVRERMIGGDVTGEISVARYQKLWKRVLSGLDGQSPPDAASVRAWQAQQHAVNLRLLAALERR